MILGKNLIIKYGGSNIACARSCSIDISQSFLSVCSPSEGRVKAKVPTDYSWSVSASGLISSQAYINALANMLTAGTKIDILIVDSDSGVGFTGSAFVNSLSESGSVGGLSSYDIQLEGSGALSNATFVPVEDLREGIFTYSNSTLSYNIEGKTGTVGGQFTLSAGSHSITVYGYGAVGIVKSDVEYIKEVLRNDDWDRSVIEAGILTAAASAAGQAVFTINSPGTYTIVGNKGGIRSAIAV